MRQATCLALLLLGLVALDTASARLFNTGNQHLKREVGKRRRDKEGHVHYKEVDAEHLGRAAFDPHYGLDEDLTAEDLGYDADAIHDASPSVIENRLRELFPSIDTNHDGVLSTDELQRHLFVNGIGISLNRANAEFNDTDANHDGKVTPEEYLTALVEDDDEKGKAGIKDTHMPDPIDYGSYIEVTRVSMMLADQNHDGALDRDEFYDFLNPEEGNNIPLKLHLLRQDIYEHLTAETAAMGHERHAHHPAPELSVSFDQFMKFFWGQFTVWDGHGDEWSEEKERESALRKFVLLDSNADNKLVAEELLPAFADIHPTENRYARMQAENMMQMADCSDDRLTLEQMLAVPHAFYSAVHEHDEL